MEKENLVPVLAAVVKDLRIRRNANLGENLQ